MPSEDTKIFEFNQYQKSDKTPLIIYADLECVIEKIDKNNPANSYTTKLSEYIPSGFYNLLIVQDLWQAHYQILSMIFLKEFIELNVNMDMMIKNVKDAELNIKDHLMEYKCLCCNKNY